MHLVKQGSLFHEVNVTAPAASPSRIYAGPAPIEPLVWTRSRISAEAWLLVDPDTHMLVAAYELVDGRWLWSVVSDAGARIDEVSQILGGLPGWCGWVPSCRAAEACILEVIRG